MKYTPRPTILHPFNPDQVNEIKESVSRVTGLEFSQFAVKSRKRNLVIARNLFAFRCSLIGIDIWAIGSILGKNRVTIIHAIKTYKNDCLKNESFRNMAVKVGCDIYLNNLKEAV